MLGEDMISARMFMCAWEHPRSPQFKTRPFRKNSRKSLPNPSPFSLGKKTGGTNRTPGAILSNFGFLKDPGAPRTITPTVD
jgi:hypothetical protein